MTTKDVCAKEKHFDLTKISKELVTAIATSDILCQSDEHMSDVSALDVVTVQCGVMEEEVEDYVRVNCKNDG